MPPPLRVCGPRSTVLSHPRCGTLALPPTGGRVACPVSTGGGTRLVRLVRGRGGGRVAQRAAAKCAAAAGARGRGSGGCASSTRSRSHAGARRASRGAAPMRSACTGRVRTKPGRVRRPMRTRVPRRLAVCDAHRGGAGLCTRLCSRTWRWRRPASGARRAGRNFLRRSSTSGTSSAC